MWLEKNRCMEEGQEAGWDISEAGDMLYLNGAFVWRRELDWEKSQQPNLKQVNSIDLKQT